MGAQRVGDHALGVRRIEVEDVVVPVALQDGTVAIEVTGVGRERIGRGDAGEELRNEIDEHLGPGSGPNLDVAQRRDKPGSDGGSLDIRPAACQRTVISVPRVCAVVPVARSVTAIETR